VKNLLKGYEVLSQVFMFGFLVLMLLALTEGSMDAAVGMMLISFFFIMLVSWTHSAHYINWKNRKGYGKV